MKILFIYAESGFNTWNNISFKNGRYYHGVGILSAVLKKNGHEVNLIHLKSEINKNNFVSEIKKINPDLICVSATTHMLTQIIKIDNILYRYFRNIPSIIGGAIAGVEPELINKFKSFQAAVAGEAEITILKIIENIKKGQHINFEIPNALSKFENKNLEVECIHNLDTLPFADREIFRFETLDDYAWFKRLPMITSRGCRYSCSFCTNSVMRKYYKSGEYLRFRSPASIVEEIKYNIEKYPEINHIQFQSDLFFKDTEWLKSFGREYSRINLPYHCLLRVEQVNDENLELLKKSGCELILMGVESGSDSVREKTGKMLKTNQVIEAFDKIKKYKIKTGTFNIMGLPGETLDSVISSFRINAEIKPDLAQISIYYPYKNTAMFEMVRNKLNKKGETYTTYFEKSLFKEKYLIHDFYFYYENFLKFTELYIQNQNPVMRKAIDIGIKTGIIKSELLKKVKPSIFRIIF